ncbi:Fc.00g055360.m01.CDS01 [Cosmosporella sp. VM-42]
MLAFFLLFSTIAHAVLVTGPSGPWPVSHQVVELTDESRWDPYAPENSPHKRRILTSFFLPIHVDQRKCEVDKIDYLPPETLETYGKVATGLGLPNTTFHGFELEFCRASSKKQLPHPVVIFSPGFSNSRLLSSAQAQSLASQGNIVITVDHPYEATVVEFPDGTVVYGFTADEVDEETAEKAVKVCKAMSVPNLPTTNSPAIQQVRSQDISFLIDQIMKQSNLGHSLDGRFDTRKIFVYGHSLGGATSASVALNDDRVLGGLDLDGALYGPVREAGLDVPFFVIGAESSMNATLYFTDFMDKLHGPKMFFTIDGSTHLSFIDIPLLLSLRDDISPDLEPVIAKVFGTIDGKRVAGIVNNVLGMVTSFLFKGKAGSLCKLDDEISEAVTVVRDLKGACRN